MPSSIKDSIIINCATKIILDHSEHRQNLPEVKAVLSITDEEAYMIESLQRTERWREFFIKMSNDAFIFRNEVSDFAAVAFDSRQATVVRLKQLFNESGSTYTAINAIWRKGGKSMDDATQGLTALLAGQPTSTAAHTILPEALPPHFWALRSFSWYGHSPRKRKCQELSDSLAGMCHIHPIIHHQQITVMKESFSYSDLPPR